MSSVDLKIKKKTSKSSAWSLVTNHMNMLYMMAAGLVTEPAIFKKYYADSLEAKPGWIPLFRCAVPAQALDQAIKERSHLRPCILSFDLTGLTGSVEVLSKSGNVRDANFPKVRMGTKELGILVQTPMPLTLVSRINFRSDEDRQAFVAAAKDVANVNLEAFDIQVNESLFVETTDDAWPPEFTEKPHRRSNRNNESEEPQRSLLPDEVWDAEASISPQREQESISAQSLGGLIAMLYHTANQSDLGREVFCLAAKSVSHEQQSSLSDAILAQLPAWLSAGRVATDAPPPAKLFWGAVSAVDSASHEINSQEPIEAVLSYLDAQVFQLSDEQYRMRLERLIADMRGTLGLGGSTISELFERHKGPLSRSLLLFCLRKNCVELLEFSNLLFGATDRLLSGILFGVRDGWLKLPKEMRNKELSDYVMYRMADAAFVHKGVEMTFPETLRPHPLRELFTSASGVWSDAQTSAAEEIVKANNWLECIKTVISSADGSPLPEPIEENGEYIFLGSATAIEKLEEKLFLDRLGQWPPIDASLESLARRTLSAALAEELNLV